MFANCKQIDNDNSNANKAMQSFSKLMSIEENEKIISNNGEITV